MLSKSCLMACLTGVLGILPLIAKADLLCPTNFSMRDAIDPAVRPASRLFTGG